MADTMVAILRREFDPTFRMLTRLIDGCPDSLWEKPVTRNPFWQQVMHALISVQFWFREKDEAFAPPDLGAGPVPDLDTVPTAPVGKAAVRTYQAALEARIDAFFRRLDDARLVAPSTLYAKATYADLILGQIRHVQHHVGYCNALLSGSGAAVSAWLDAE